MSIDLIFFLFLLGIEKGNFTFPLKMEQISETNDEVVGPGPAPSPWIVNLPIGIPSIITAFKTPLILLIKESVGMKVTTWMNFNAKNNLSVKHDHSGSVLSGVLWV